MKINNIINLANKIILGDCLEIMKQIPDNSLDMTFADPPFNLKKKYNHYEDSKEKEELMSKSLDSKGKKRLKKIDKTIEKKLDKPFKKDVKQIKKTEKEQLLREKNLDKYSNFKILFQQTSIYDIISIVQLVSYGLSVFDDKFFELSELLEKYLDEFKSQALIVFDRNGIIISEYYSDIQPEVYIQLLESIKEHLFLLKRMEEETYEADHDISIIEHKLFSYLHRLKIGQEPFFVSVATKDNQKEDFLEKFPDFLESLKKILEEMM